MTVTEDIHKAKHYNLHPSGVEVRQITDYMTFNQGSTFKYVVRRDAKGTPIKDLLKAIEYLDYQLETGAPPIGMFDPALTALSKMVAAEPNPQVRHILLGLGGYAQMGIPAILKQTQHDIKILLEQDYRYEFK